jgi:hypothetical protein
VDQQQPKQADVFVLETGIGTEPRWISSCVSKPTTRGQTFEWTRTCIAISPSKTKKKGEVMDVREWQGFEHASSCEHRQLGI